MTRRGAVPDLFTLPELEAYAADDWDPVRAPTIVELTLGTVYGLIPEAVADTSVRAKAIGLEAAKRAMELYDPQTGEVTDSQGAVWSGPCRIRPAGGGSTGGADEVGGAEVFTYDYMVSLPVAVDVVVAGHRLTVTASPDAALAGVTMEVQRVDRGDTITARRLFCRDVA
jgi:hypothetical protein